jgi:hypothetical protein
VGLGLADLEWHHDATAAAINAAKKSVLVFPAQSAADVLAKLRFAVKVADVDGQSLSAVEPVIVDLGRLVG